MSVVQKMTPADSLQAGAINSKRNEAVACPFCGSSNTAKEAAFGTTHAYSQFYCRACRTPFEWIKWEEREPAHDLPNFLQAR